MGKKSRRITRHVGRVKRSVKKNAKNVRRRMRSVRRRIGRRRFLRWTRVGARKMIRRVKRFPKKPMDARRQSHILDWLKSSKKRKYQRIRSTSKKASLRTTQSSHLRTKMLTTWDYQKLVNQMHEEIGNESVALKKAEKENTFLKVVLEHTRKQLQEMHLPVSVRHARARSINRLSAELIMKVCTFLDDELLFRCRVLCRGFHSGYLNQEIDTASRAERINMRRLVQLARMGRVFSNVSIVLVNYSVPNRCKLRGIDNYQFPSMRELVIEVNGSFCWSKLSKNPNIRYLTVLNAKVNFTSITMKRYPNLEYLTVKLFGPKGRFWKLTDLPKHTTIKRIDLVNMEPENKLSVEMIRPLMSKTKFPDLKMIGVLNKWSMPVEAIWDIWLFLNENKIQFRYTCSEYDFSDGNVRWLDGSSDIKYVA